MTPSEKDDSARRLLVEIQLLNAPGVLVGDGRFVMEVKDGIGRVQEHLRGLKRPFDIWSIDLRVSELLLRNERDELERLRQIVRHLPKEAIDGE